jgi:hypothetical protein
VLRTYALSHNGLLRLLALESGTHVGEDWRDDGDGTAVYNHSIVSKRQDSRGRMQFWDSEIMGHRDKESRHRMDRRHWYLDCICSMSSLTSARKLIAVVSKW